MFGEGFDRDVLRVIIRSDVFDCIESHTWPWIVAGEVTWSGILE